MRLTLLTLGWLALFTPFCQAASLSELLAGGAITSGSLRFSEFSYLPDSGLPAAGDVTVSPAVDAAGDAGLRFDWSVVWPSQSPTKTAKLTYTVESMLPGRHLASAQMTGDPAGSGILTVRQIFPVLSGQFNFIFARSGTRSLTDELSPDVFGLKGRFERHQVVSDLSVGSQTSISFFEQTFAMPEPSADFNDDSWVDGDDFLTWQRRVNASTSASSDGDANIDGRVDSDDLAVWTSQLGPQTSAVAVPEPSVAAMILAAALASCAVSRRCL